ncbi:hypothetical protein C8F04DRAFT_1331601, partial [Mycena alexandri]
MDIKFIGSGPAAKAILYYITDYITKSQLQAHVAYAALEVAVHRLGDFNPEEDDLTSRAKRLLQKCAHSLISKQEMSAQQVVSYLMDFEDHFTSHELTMDASGKLVPTATQACDYQKRGDLLENVSVWDFVAQTEKEKLTRSQMFSAGSDEESDDEDRADGPEGTASVTDESPWTKDNILDFDGKMPRVRFQTAHLQDNTHTIKVRSYFRRKIPVPIGPALPRRDTPASEQKHARLMLILFKPWRHASDLREAGQTWLEAYMEFLPSCSEEVLERIINMQLLHECRDSRDAH